MCFREGEHHDHRMHWRFSKTVVLIELLCPLVQRVYEQRPDSGVLRDRLHTNYGISKQGRAELHTLSARINREPCEHHHRDWIRHIAPDSANGFLVRNGPRRQSVIPKHALVMIDHDKSATGPAQVVNQCAPFEPIV